MSPSEFSQLSGRDRVRMILQRGVFIESVQQGVEQVKLYALDMLFIEVWGDPLGGQVTHMAIASEEDLEKFLPGIESL